MKKIYVNLKRFDTLKEFGGVNTETEIFNWASRIVERVTEPLATIKQQHDVEFTIYFPEAHLIPAIQALGSSDVLAIGCQSVYREDTQIGGNFGAFTSQRPANAMKQLGVTSTIIGHLEERLDKKGVLSNAGLSDFNSVDTLFNQEIKAAHQAGLNVLYCIGETAEERSEERWQEVLEGQLLRGLEGVALEKVVIAYEPVWAIGVGKQPPTADEVAEVIAFIKSIVPDIDVIYGGGLKKNNAKELASIDSLDGGLIALTRFEGDIGFYTDEFIEIVEIFLN